MAMDANSPNRTVSPLPGVQMQPIVVLHENGLIMCLLSAVQLPTNLLHRLHHALVAVERTINSTQTHVVLTYRRTFDGFGGASQMKEIHFVYLCLASK